MNPTPGDEHRALTRYLREIRRVANLSREEEERLTERISRGDREASDRLVEANLSFVAKVAREYRSLGVPYEDLLNEGNLGLIEAAKRYDRGRGTRFITYAVWWIRKRILEAIADHSLIVRVPASRREKTRELRKAESSLANRLGRAPTRDEIARDLSVRTGEVDRVQRLHFRYDSLDRPVGRDDATSLIEFLEDVDASVEDRLLSEEARSQVVEAFGELSAREQAVLAWRLGLGEKEPWKLHQVGTRLGISRERVRQVENEAKQRLRRKLLARFRGRPRRRD